MITGDYKMIEIKNYDGELEVSPFHKLKEFICDDISYRQNMLTQYMHNEIIVDNIIQLCNQLLTPIEHAYKKKFTILSGYRCHALNTLYAKDTSQMHLRGYAVDVKPMEERETIRGIIRNLPFHECFLFKRHWHLSYKEFNRENRLYDAYNSGRGKVW